MKNKVLAGLLITVMVLPLAACGSTAASSSSTSTETADSKEEAEASEDEETADFSGISVEIDADGTLIDDSLEQFQAVVDAFNEETGADIEVVTNGNDQETIMKTRMASNDMPDMFMTHGWATIRYNEFCMDLADEPWTSDMVDAAASVVTDKNGKVCACPLTEWVYGMPYNKTVAEANGVDMSQIRTWDDLEEALSKITESGIKGIAGPGKSGLGGYLEQCNVFYSNDGALYDDAAALLDGTFNFTENPDVFERFAALYDAGYFIDDLFTTDGDGARAYIANETAAMFVWGSPEWVQIMKDINPDDEFGIMPTPAAADGGKAAYTVGEGTSIAISNATEHPEVCKAFLEYITKPENLKSIVDSTGAISGFSTVTQDDSYGLVQYNKSLEGRDDITYSNFFDRQYLPSGMWNYMTESVAMLFDCEPGEAGAKVAETAEYLQDAYEELYATNNQ